MDMYQKREMRKNKKIAKRYVISVCLNILILVICFVVGALNLKNLINSNDTFSNLIGVFGSMILPYIGIAIIIEIIVFALYFINKKNKQSLNIVSLIVEIVYFIFTNFAVIPFMLLNLLSFGRLLAYMIFLIFEICNIYIIVLTIKKIIQCKKGCDKDGK